MPDRGREDHYGDAVARRARARRQRRHLPRPTPLRCPCGHGEPRHRVPALLLRRQRGQPDARPALHRLLPHRARRRGRQGGVQGAPAREGRRCRPPRRPTRRRRVLRNQRRGRREEGRRRCVGPAPARWWAGGGSAVSRVTHAARCSCRPQAASCSGRATFASTSTRVTFCRRRARQRTCPNSAWSVGRHSVLAGGAVSHRLTRWGPCRWAPGITWRARRSRMRTRPRGKP